MGRRRGAGGGKTDLLHLLAEADLVPGAGGVAAPVQVLLTFLPGQQAPQASCHACLATPKYNSFINQPTFLCKIAF